jgi:hypothetical protein
MQNATRWEMTRQRVVVSLALLVGVVLFASEASAVCCHRKPNFGCCGVGPCNIFCCNCDNGCNMQCENTTCDTAAWLQCAAIVTVCGTACALTTGQACIECLGASYHICVKCYAGTTTALSGAAADLLARNNRDYYFHDIAEFDGDPNTISEADFADHVETEKMRTGLHATTASIRTMFRAFDVDGSGFIERDEIDNDEVIHGLAYPQAESDQPESDTPPSR